MPRGAGLAAGLATFDDFKNGVGDGDGPSPRPNRQHSKATELKYHSVLPIEQPCSPTLCICNLAALTKEQVFNNDFWDRLSMHYWFQRWSIVAKLRFMAFLGIGCLLALATWQGYDTYQRGYAERQNATRNTVEVAHGILLWAHSLETSGKVSREAAQTMAKAP
jgi:hypothetical protein